MTLLLRRGKGRKRWEEGRGGSGGKRKGLYPEAKTKVDAYSVMDSQRDRLNCYTNTIHCIHERQMNSTKLNYNEITLSVDSVLLLLLLMKFTLNDIRLQLMQTSFLSNLPNKFI